MSDSFRAVVARQADGKQSVAVETMAENALPAGDVLVDVEYSSLNYKDGLALMGGNRILRAAVIRCARRWHTRTVAS